MNSRLLLFVALLLAVGIIAGCTGPDQIKTEVAPVTLLTPSDKHQIATLQLVNQLASGDYPAAYDQFDDTMKEALPVDKIKQVWETVTKQYGAYKNPIKFQTVKQSDYDIVIMTGIFGDNPLNVQVAFDKNGKISGLYFKQIQ